MKNTILFIAFTGLILSTNAQDTLKLKTVKTYYGETDGNVFYRIGELDGAVINTDSLSLLFPELLVVNISNDTFSSDVRYEMRIDFFLYADTGLLMVDHNVSQRWPIFREFFPNDTVNLGLMAFSMSAIIDYNKEQGIELEQISYWKIIAGISYTSKDGTYSESVFYEGADTSIFYMVRGGVGMQEIEQNPNVVFVYPNPTKGQLQITNYELDRTADYSIYNVMGQKVLQDKLSDETSVINVESLAAGMYYLRIAEKTIKFIKE